MPATSKTASTSKSGAKVSASRSAAAPKASTSKAASGAAASSSSPSAASKRTRASEATPTTKPAVKKAKVDSNEEKKKPVKATTKAASATKTAKVAPAAAKPSSSAKKATSKTRPTKSPLTSTKPVLSDDEDLESEGEDEDEDSDDDGDDSSLDSDEENEMLKGMTSDEGADSSDDDDEDDDGVAIGKLSEITAAKLPSSKDDAAVRARLAKVEARRKAQPASQKVDRAVLYFGHLPRNFSEGPLKGYLSQFGTVTRVRLSRNKKTGASKHYAFVEFADDEVATIVQETMDNYLIMGRLLRVKPVDKDDIHPKLWIGANRTFRKVPEGRIARVQHDGPKTEEGKKRTERKLLERQQKKKQSLKEQGYDYDFEGYQA